MSGEGSPVRPEKSADHEAVHHINELVFETSAEADLVDALRRDAHPIVSLVAERADQIVGHILFTPVTIDERKVRAMGLAPMAVLPGHQRTGVGSSLIKYGLDACRAIGAELIVVVGHPEYYPKFGFVAASRFALRCEYDVPDDVFMALELSPGAASGGGLVRYHAAFASV